MIKAVILLLILPFICSFTQSLDSISTEVKLYPDTTFIHADSLLLNDSLLTKVTRDSIVPIYSQALTENSFIIRMMNYRTTIINTPAII